MEKYVTVQDASKKIGIPERTLYRLAKELKMMTTVYGRMVLPSACLPTLKASKRGIGNPNWKKGSRAAARDGKRGGLASAAESHIAAPSGRVAKGSR